MVQRNGLVYISQWMKSVEGEMVREGLFRDGLQCKECQ